jgi:accessory colonization factor AcfC
MANAGYSGTPLLKKLGIKEAMKVRLVDAPADYFDLLQTDISEQLAGNKSIPDLVHLFAKNNAVFENAMKALQPVYKKNPQLIIWVSWYKKSAGIATDITEDTIRRYALSHDLVDVKVCAVSDIWSGLKLVVPVVKR